LRVKHSGFKMEKKKQRGGKRVGSGRPRCQPTSIITFRVPDKWKDEIVATVNDWIRDIRIKDLKQKL
jgi:hypothetical protein